MPCKSRDQKFKLAYCRDWNKYRQSDVLSVGICLVSCSKTLTGQFEFVITSYTRNNIIINQPTADITRYNDFNREISMLISYSWIRKKEAVRVIDEWYSPFSWLKRVRYVKCTQLIDLKRPPPRLLWRSSFFS